MADDVSIDNRKDDPRHAYAREKLWQALGCLIQEGTLQKRLVAADDFLIRLDAQNFPAELKQKFLNVKLALLRNASELNGVHDTSNPDFLTERELEEVADEILSLFVKMNHGIR